MSVAPEPTATLEAALAHATRLLAVDPALAAEQAREILKAVGPDPRAQLVLAASHRLRGEVDAALAILEPLAAAQPRAAAVHLELGIALGLARRGAEAITALRHALALKPALPQAWQLLGDHLLATGDMAGADAAYAQHVRHSVRDPGLMRAAAALSENRIPEAEALLRAHLRQTPNDVAALRMLAEVGARIGRTEDAELLLTRCLELAPSFHEARQNHAQVLHRANKPERALAEIDRLLAVDPAHPGYRNLRAVVLCRIGEYEQAIPLYARLVREYPDQSRIWLSHGHALKTVGRTAESIDAYRRCIALEPGFGEAWWSLANLKTYRFDDDEVATMRRELARGDLDAEHRLHLEFSLGKALEDRREHAGSFAHYEAGNALRRASVPWDADENASRLDRVVATYTPEFFARRTGWGAPGRDPVFILGMPRAGSTLLEQILSSHSLVEGTSELPEVLSITRMLRRDAGAAAGASGENVSYHDVLAGLDAGQVAALGERYLERTRIQRKTDAPFFIDKMPNNYAHVGLIHLILPNARIIDARRHPLACCFSNFKQHYARGQTFAYGLDDLGRYYRDYVELMAHFDAVLTGRVHRVIHERLIDDPEREVRALLDHCGLPFEDACLRFHENERAVRTASSEQVRRPLNREGVDQWRSYEPWLDPLKRALGSVLEAYPDVPAFKESAGED
ncbi:MAG TPA: sulfotransferase [Xanthomonadaceae bacterium]